VSGGVSGGQCEYTDTYSSAQLLQMISSPVRVSSAALQQQGLCPAAPDLPLPLAQYVAYADRLTACCGAVRLAGPLLRAGTSASAPTSTHTAFASASTSTSASAPTSASTSGTSSSCASKFTAIGRVRPLLLLHSDRVERLRQQRRGGDAVVVKVCTPVCPREGKEVKEGGGVDGEDAAHAVVLMGNAVAASTHTPRPGSGCGSGSGSGDRLVGEAEAGVAVAEAVAVAVAAVNTQVCLTVLLSYCLTVLLSYCLTVLPSYHLTILPSHYLCTHTHTHTHSHRRMCQKG
jgi:hypothetical protein